MPTLTSRVAPLVALASPLHFAHMLNQGEITTSTRPIAGTQAPCWTGKTVLRQLQITHANTCPTFSGWAFSESRDHGARNTHVRRAWIPTVRLQDSLASASHGSWLDQPAFSVGTAACALTVSRIPLYIRSFLPGRGCRPSGGAAVLVRQVRHVAAPFLTIEAAASVCACVLNRLGV